jgi:hypothetical protein
MQPNRVFALRSLFASVPFRTLALAALVGVATGCSASSESDLVKGELVVSGSQSALTEEELGSLKLEGTYAATCDGHASDGSDAWTSDDVTVRKNDADCVLTITAIDIGEAQYHASSGLALEESFAGSALAYADADGTKRFYANAKISDASFGGDFVITVLTSADTTSSDVGDSSGEYATQGGTVSAGAVAPPSYEASFAPLHVSMDANDVVQEGGVTGYVQLFAGGSADRFAVYDGHVDPSSFEDVETAFGSGAALSGLDQLRIPASYFAGLEGDDLDVNEVWTIMLRHEVEGVRSYQLLYITFKP